MCCAEFSLILWKRSPVHFQTVSNLRALNGTDRQLRCRHPRVGIPGGHRPRHRHLPRSCGWLALHWHPVLARSEAARPCDRPAVGTATYREGARCAAGLADFSRFGLPPDSAGWLASYVLLAIRPPPNCTPPSTLRSLRFFAFYL